MLHRSKRTPRAALYGPSADRGASRSEALLARGGVDRPLNTVGHSLGILVLPELPATYETIVTPRGSETSMASPDKWGAGAKSGA